MKTHRSTETECERVWNREWLRCCERDADAYACLEGYSEEEADSMNRRAGPLIDAYTATRFYTAAGLFILEKLLAGFLLKRIYC
jgi:hypothetical protein